MLNFFRRPVAEAATPHKKRKVRKPSSQPLTWEDQFAPIPNSEAVEGNNDGDWTLWDDSALCELRKVDHAREDH